MDGTNPRCATIVERSYPPNRSITGESACDLARFLIEQYDMEVHIVHLDSEYQGGSNAIAPIGIQHILPTGYNGKGKIRRFMSSLSEGKALIKKAIEINKGPIICMTSPPLLNFWASRLIPQGRPWFLWSMDVFPEAFVSSKLSSPRNFVYKFFKKQTYKHAPNKLIALGPIQAAYLKNLFRKEIDTSILPCGIMHHKGEEEIVEVPEWKKANSDKIIFGYCGNIGEAHSPEFLMECIASIDPDKHHFILVAYGVHGDKIRAFAKDKPGVSIYDSVPRAQLAFIDVNIVSLKKEWVNVCVPSKLVSAVYVGSNFLFCGIEECDNWKMMQDAGWLIKDDDNMKREVRKFFKTINNDMLIKAKQRAKLRSQKMVDRSLKSYHDIALAIIDNQN